MLRSVSRVLAAAVSSACMLAPTPSLAWSITVNASSACSNPIVDSSGNITINCAAGGPTNNPPPPPPPPPTDGTVISCAGKVDGVTGATHVIDIAWATMIGRLTTSSNGGFGRGDAVVIHFKPTTGLAGVPGSISFSPSAGAPANPRKAVLSQAPCTSPSELGARAVKYGIETAIYFTVGGSAVNKYGGVDTATPNLVVGRDYYLTIVNTDSAGNNTCTASSCDLNMGLIKPAGL